MVDLVYFMLPLLQIYMLFFVPVQAIAVPLSLNEVIQRALRDSPVLAAERQREHISDLELQNRSNAFYPRLDLESSHGIGETKADAVTDPWISASQLKISEKLYDNGVNWTKYKQGKQDREVAKLNYLRVRDGLVYLISEKFYAYSKATLVLEAVKAQKELIDKQFESVTQKFKQGLRTKRDYLRLKAQAQKMQIDARFALNSKEKIRLELLRLMGMNPFAPATLETDFSAIAPENLKSSGATIPPKLENTYEVRIAKGLASAKQFDVNLSQRSYWPELNLVSGVYYRNDAYIGSGRHFRDTEGYGWNVLLQLNYNFWDWGERRREWEKAESNQLIYDHEARKTELETATELQQLANNIKDSHDNLIVSEELLKAQTEAHEVIRRDYSEGRAEYQDLITSQTELLDAKGRYYESRFDLATLIEKQKYFEGTLYEQYQK